MILPEDTWQQSMTGIVILNYRTWELSIRCMESIWKHTADARIYLVDNASPGTVPDKIRKYLHGHPQAVLIEAEENRGYAAGNNIGIKRALDDGCDAIIITNNDIVFLQDSIPEMAAALDAGNRIGIAGPKVVDEKGIPQPSCISRKTGIKEKALFYTGLKYLCRKKRKQYYCIDEDPNRQRLVYSVSGCCFAISADCAKDVTPLDENTFLYEEELILGIRMEQKGWMTLYEPKAAVRHLHGATTDTVKPFAYQCIAQSEQYYMDAYLHAEKWQLMLMRIYRRMMYDLHCIKDKDFREYRSKFRQATKWTSRY